jgi:hypothetical protein
MRLPGPHTSQHCCRKMVSQRRSSRWMPEPAGDIVQELLAKQGLLILGDLTSETARMKRIGYA